MAYDIKKIKDYKKAQGPTVEELQSVFITEDITIADLAKRYKMTYNTVEELSKENNWVDLRKAYIRSGVAKIQNSQIQQAEKLLSLENGFKKLKLIQLEKLMEGYSAYYERYGHLNKVYPDSGVEMKDTDGMVIPIKIPNVANEIRNLRESFNVGEGLYKILDKLNEIMAAGQPVKELEVPDIIDISEYSELFEEKDEHE